MTTNEQTKTPLEQLREMVEGAKVSSGDELNATTFGPSSAGVWAGNDTIVASVGMRKLVEQTAQALTAIREDIAESLSNWEFPATVTWPKTVKSTHEVWARNADDGTVCRVPDTRFGWFKGNPICVRARGQRYNRASLERVGYSPAGTLTLYDDGSHEVEWNEEDDAQTKGKFGGVKAYHVVVDEASPWAGEWKDEKAEDVVLVEEPTKGHGFAEFLGSCAHTAPMKKTREDVGVKADAAGLALALAVEWTCTSCSQPFNDYRKEVPGEKRLGLCADCYLGWGGNGSVMRPLDKRIDDSRRERAPVETAWSTPGYGDDPMGGV